MILEKRLMRHKDSKMQVRRICFFDDFQCIGASCPANCCQGWKIPLDHSVYMKYLKEKGIFGAKLRYYTRRSEESAAFRSPLGRCPFWGGDRLCEIQKKHGAEYMPAVCVQFPRQLYNLGFFCEETLYLACPEAARLFLEHTKSGKPFGYVMAEAKVSYEPNTTNDDEIFLKYLVRSRDSLAGMLRKGMDFDSMAILDYGQDAQNACLGGNALPDPLDYKSDRRYTVDAKAVNKLFYGGFYHPNLRTVNRQLYKLCRKYIRGFGVLCRINPQAADQKLLAMRRDIQRKIPNLGTILNRYYEYYLLTNFLDIYEDYSFRKCLVFGMVKANMVWLFLALYAAEKERVELEEIAKVIAIYERRAPQMKDALKKLD